MDRFEKAVHVDETKKREVPMAMIALHKVL